jgi:dihydroflavonol-4-reductase
MNEIPMYPKNAIAVVDVRDVARAHLEAVLRDEASGKRFILCADNPFMFDLVNVMKEKFGNEYPVKEAKEMPIIIPFFMRLWDKEMAGYYERWGKNTVVVDGSFASNILGIDYIGYDKMMQDMGIALIETGYVVKK